MNSLGWEKNLASSKERTKSYRVLSAELDELMNWFESGDVNLDEAVVKYKKAMELITELESYLKTAENEIKKITASFEQ
jgi:exodeoxyribonuclease VII small subunit